MNRCLDADVSATAVALSATTCISLSICVGTQLKGAEMMGRTARARVNVIKFPDFTLKYRLSVLIISPLNHRRCVTTCRRRRRTTPPWRAPAAPCAHPNLSWGLPAASWRCSRCWRRPPRPRLRSASRAMKIIKSARRTHTGTAARAGSWRLTNSSLLSQNFTVWSWPTLAMNARSNVLRHSGVSAENGGRGGGKLHAQALHREIAVLSQHADQSVGMDVNETHQPVAAASARHVCVDRDKSVDALGVAGEPEGGSECGAAA